MSVLFNTENYWQVLKSGNEVIAWQKFLIWKTNLILLFNIIPLSQRYNINDIFQRHRGNLWFLSYCSSNTFEDYNSIFFNKNQPHLKHHMIAIYRCHVPCFSYDAGSTWCLERGPWKDVCLTAWSCSSDICPCSSNILSTAKVFCEWSSNRGGVAQKFLLNRLCLLLIQVVLIYTEQYIWLQEIA